MSLGAAGSAPGWHQCISNGGANGGGHWVYLPQLDAQHGCNHGTPPPPPAKNPCVHVTGANNGVYCGSSTQDGFDPNAADRNTLYDCVNGAVASSQFCANGCYVAPAGKSDRCYTNGNRCANVPGYANGLFCGLSTQYGFDPSQADAATVYDWVYDCENGEVASSTRCPNRCVVSSSGSDSRA